MPVWVRGEVVQCKVWSSGHWYFTLRDRQSQVRCCMWKPVQPGQGEPPDDGTEVFVLARPGHLRGEGRVPARRHPHDPDRGHRRSSSRSWSG